MDAGIDEVPVCWVDVDDETALRLLLADNRTTRLGRDDENVLAELLAELANSEAGLVGTGYDGDFLDELISDLAGNEKGARVEPKEQEIKNQSIQWHDQRNSRPKRKSAFAMLCARVTRVRRRWLMVALIFKLF